MNDILLSELDRAFKRCSDCLLIPEYISLLDKLNNIKLLQEHIDYLCDKVVSKNHIWEIRFDHLRILLLNPSATEYDLKAFYYENLKKCRRLVMKIFFIRGYAIYASEEELIPIMEKFQKSLEKNHDYIDYNYILSVAGLPYLVNKYGYNCFANSLEKAQEKYEQIDPLLRGYFTLNQNLEQINLLTHEEVLSRTYQLLKKSDALYNKNFPIDALAFYTILCYNEKTNFSYLELDL